MVNSIESLIQANIGGMRGFRRVNEDADDNKLCLTLCPHVPSKGRVRM